MNLMQLPDELISKRQDPEDSSNGLVIIPLKLSGRRLEMSEEN